MTYITVRGPVFIFVVSYKETWYNGNVLRSDNMKKIVGLCMLVIMLVGCGASSQYIMVQNKAEKYGLYEMDSDEKTDFVYDDYQKIEGAGYIVQKGKQFGYIDNTGKELIKVGDYEKIEALQGMVVAYDKKEKVTIFDVEGKELSKEDKKTKITIKDLPIIKKEKKYEVLNTDGTELISSKKEIINVSVINTMYILIGYKDTIDVVDVLTKEEQTIKLEGTYEFKDYHDKMGYLLYNEEDKKMAHVTLENKVNFEISHEADALYFDNNKNIVLKKDQSIWLVSNDGSQVMETNSYYKDSKNYVSKNNDYIYGPHTFYKDGKDNVVDGIQLDPLASYTKYTVFPVYVKEKGYQFYSYDGKPVFKTIYRKATSFDINERSIVTEDDKDYYLVDTKNKKCTKEYKRLEHISKNYYAAYTTENKYNVIDKDGKVLLDMYFIGDKTVTSFNDTDYGIFSRSGKSYIYDMKSYELLFTCEESVTFIKDGYFVSENKTYYDMKGEKIYSR